MNGFSISQAAEQAGIPATTLRYYEDQGIVGAPIRAENGYRRYSERDVQRLRFLGRARRLDLTPSDLRDLAEAWDSDECAVVQHRLSGIVRSRLDEAQREVVELTELTAELQRVAARVRRTPKPGPCDEQCECGLMDEPPAAPSVESFIPLTTAGSAPIACTLAPEEMGTRLDDWQRLLALAAERRPLKGGLMLIFPQGAAVVAELARLAAAEQECCAFFDFRMHLTGSTVEFEVRAAPEAQELITGLFGDIDEGNGR